MTEAAPPEVKDPEPMSFRRPLSGLFALNKPAGMTCMSLVESLKSLFMSSKLFVEEPVKFKERPKSRLTRKTLRRIKIGQGGTLDPLASGVLVIGLNSATKKLSGFLDGTKTYRTIGLLGCETDSYDSLGKVVELAEWKHVKPEHVVEQCQSMLGEIWQIPPIYSALKMDGKPLYEYARSNLPLPRPIEARQCQISDIRMTNWQEGGSGPDAHTYKWPTEMITDEERKMRQATDKLIQEKGIQKVGLTDIEPTSDTLNGSAKRLLPEEESSNKAEIKKQKLEDSTDLKSSHPPILADTAKIEQMIESESGLSPAFTLEMTVSSGTYVRTIVHDIGKAVSSAATVVSLVRTRQGRFVLDEDSQPIISEKPLSKCIEWEVFEKAIEAMNNETEEISETDGLREWERKLLEVIEN